MALCCSTLSSVSRQLFICFLSLFYGTLVVLRLFYLHIKLGFRHIFNSPDHSKRPAVLDDPQLGKHHSVEVDKYVIHYIAKGNPNDQLIVFLHGFPDFWFTWREQLKEFGSNGYYAVAIDLPGYGESSKVIEPGKLAADKIVHALIKVIQDLVKSKDQKVILIGHDWGAVIAYYLAGSYPDLFSKLIILNGPHPVQFNLLLRSNWNQFLKSWYIVFFSLPCIPEWAIKTADYIILKSAFRKTNGELIFPDDADIEPWKYIYSQPNAVKSALRIYRDNIKPAQDFKKISDLRITMPLLVIWGEKDSALSVKCATEVAKYADNLTLRLVQNCSHFVHLEKPQYISQLIKEFLNSK